MQEMPKPPKNVVARARTLSKESSWPTSWLRQPAKLSEAVRVFVLPIGELNSGKSLPDAARPVSWRFQYSRGAELAAIDVYDDLEFQIERGPVVADVAEMLKQLGEAQLDEKARPRILRIPEMHITALWLAEDDGPSGTVLPLAPFGGKLPLLQRYSEAEFVAAVVEATGLMLGGDHSSPQA
jgi:hypothetical protein